MKNLNEKAVKILKENLNDARYNQENSSNDEDWWTATTLINHLQKTLMFGTDEEKIKLAGLK